MREKKLKGETGKGVAGRDSCSYGCLFGRGNVRSPPRRNLGGANKVRMIAPDERRYTSS